MYSAHCSTSFRSLCTASCAGKEDLAIHLIYLHVGHRYTSQISRSSHHSALVCRWCGVYVYANLSDQIAIYTLLSFKGRVTYGNP